MARPELLLADIQPVDTHAGHAAAIAILVNRLYLYILAEHQGRHILLGLAAVWLAGFRAVDPVQADFDLLVFCVQHRDGVAVRDADAAGGEGKQEKYEGEEGASHRRKWEMENPAGAGSMTLLLVCL